MSRRKHNTSSQDRMFWNRVAKDKYIDNEYYRRLVELSCVMFEWKNLPDNIDPRFIELSLFRDGHVLFFKDEDLGEDGKFLVTRCALGGPRDVYNIPINRRAYANNGYNNNLTSDNSVIIWNNYLRLGSYHDILLKAERLSNLDQTIDVNVNAQKTPVTIVCSENQRLTLMNAYEQYEGNSPVIFADEGINFDSMKALSTEAPFVAKDLYELKTQYWNEALTYLGISNVSFQKKERMVTDEVSRSMGGVMANRYSRLNMRQEACKQINKMFDLNVSVDYRDDFNADLYELENEMKIEHKESGSSSKDGDKDE